MNNWIDLLVVVAAIAAATTYLTLRWLRARKQKKGGLCVGGCGCPGTRITSPDR